MKQSFCLSRSMRALVYFFTAVALCVSIMAGAIVPAYAAGHGWVEITSEVPGELNSYIIFSVIEDETQEEYDFPVLAENGFSAFDEIPMGKYTVAGAWVYQDYRYTVTADLTNFVIEENSLVSVKLTVTMPGEGSEISLEGTQENNVSEPNPDEPFLENSEEGSAEEPVANEEPEKLQPDGPGVEDEESPTESRSVWVNVVITVVGVLVFAGIFFGIYFLSRRRYR